MRRHSERALPGKASGMCQSFTSVPRTYVRTADELEPLSPGARLASFPTLLLTATSSRAQSPICQLQQQQQQWRTTRTAPMTTALASSPPAPLKMPIVSPKPLPAGLPKALRPSKLPPKNLDELDALQQVGAKEPGTGLLGKCILCLLLNAVFVLALFLAFLIGHFAAEAHFPFNNKTNTSSSNSITANNHRSSSSSSLSRVGSLLTTPLVPREQQQRTAQQQHQQHDHHLMDDNQQQEEQFQQSLERSRQRVPSLGEVYPPLLHGDDPTDDSDDPLPLLSATTAAQSFGNGPIMHRSAGTFGQNVPLIPLSKTVVPKHYNVELDLTEFYGLVEPSQLRANVSILLEMFGNATAGDDELMFHAGANIFIQRVRLWKQGTQGERNGAVPIRSVKRHAEREIVRLLLGERMNHGWYWLEMEFRSRLCQSEFEGAHCFPNPTVNNDNNNDQLVSTVGAALAPFSGFSTKFEPNFARTFLPGWDEPRFRTTFNVTIRHFVGAKVLTNTAPIDSTMPAAGGNVCTTRFGTTPPMPLFLLAFATGPFTAVEMRTARADIPLTVWAAPQDTVAAHFVANFSPAMLDRLQEDFGVKYPLSKMDIFLAPKLPVGGMENWGLIVLHADAVRISTADGPLPLGTDSSSSSSSSSKEERLREQKQHNLLQIDRRSEQYRAEKAITHELVHQWFGNLVGIWEWEELWIAEGFATYFVFDFLNAADHPHLTEHEYYLRLIELVQRQSADGRSALVRPLRTAGQLYRLFDGIHLYTKGAVMVKMLKDLVGPAEFRAGITRFLRENAFKSVDRRAIWAAFPTFADHGVDPVRLKDAMESWLVNRGVPEVEVQRNYGDQSVRLRQRPADQNRHIVYLDDEVMQRMRMKNEDDKEDNEEEDEAGRMRKRVGRKGSEKAEEEDERRKMMRKGEEENEKDGEEKNGRRRLGGDNANKDDYGRKMTIMIMNEERDDDQAGWMRMRGRQKHKNDLGREETAGKDIDAILGWMEEELTGDDMNKTTTKASMLDNMTTTSTTTTMASPVAHSWSAPSNRNSNGFGIFGRHGRRGGQRPSELRRKHHHHRKKPNGHRSKNFFQQHQQRRGGGVASMTDQKSDQRHLRQQGKGKSNRKPTAGDDGTMPPPIFSAWAPRRTSSSSSSNFWGRPADHHQRRKGSLQSADNSSTSAGDSKQQQSSAEGLMHKARQSRHEQQQQQKGRRAEQEQLLGPLWPVPFSYAFGSAHSVRGQTIRQFWLLNETLRFVDVGLERAQFMLANPHWVYAYRVNYDTQNWRMLIAQLQKNHHEIPPMSRMQLIVDGEIFLGQSANPQLFVHLLSYLSNEDDLGVLLVGLDALHALLAQFSASDVFGTMMLHFVPVIRQFDRQLSLTAAHGTDPELAALWLLSPQRLAKLYQLRCAANLGTCAETKQVRRWFAHPTALAADNHQQLAALCQHLFANAGPGDVQLLSGLLKQFTTINDNAQQQQQNTADAGGGVDGGSSSSAFTAVIRQLGSACVQDEALVKLAVSDILHTRNAIVYSTALNSGYTVHYNRKFRELFWTGLSQQLGIHERQVLFAVNTGKSNRMARILLHSIRSLGELNLVERVVLDQWPESLRVEMEYLRRKLSWTEREACEQIRQHLVLLDATTKRDGKPGR